MLDNFWFHVKLGIDHILDKNGYDHMLFLLVLAVPFIFTTFFFGLIHGLGFARHLDMISDGSLIFLVEFALGIEIAQVIVVFIVLFLGFLCQTIFRLSRRDWIMVLSAIVIGLVIPMIINNNIF